MNEPLKIPSPLAALKVGDTCLLRQGDRLTIYPGVVMKVGRVWITARIATNTWSVGAKYGREDGV